MAGAALAGVGALYLIDPARHEIYPCLLRATTGLQCPGCGGLRATHQLLHGHLAAAWSLNPLAVLLVPFYALLACHIGLGLIRGHGFRWPAPRPAVIWLGLGGPSCLGSCAICRGFEDRHELARTISPGWFRLVFRL